ncbi:MAG TPA: SRPBCC family protein [Methylocella sp.]|nr:SRPBCC family protein [Methylocella sp.]
MSLAPVIHTVDVKTSPARTFELFTKHMSRWWPAGKTIAKKPRVEIVLEPRVEGRWFERDAEGGETQWGKVLIFDPPGRLVLGWQLNSQWSYDPDFLTEVELTFTHLESGGTRVRLEHRNLERFGADAEKIAGQIGTGWPAILNEFGTYAGVSANGGETK